MKWKCPYCGKKCNTRWKLGEHVADTEECFTKFCEGIGSGQNTKKE